MNIIGKNLHKMRELNEKIQSTEKEIKDLEKQLDYLNKKVHQEGNNKLYEENEDLKTINKLNKEDIINNKKQIKDLESKAKSNEEIISKLKSENEQLKRGRNSQSQNSNNQINNSINNIRDLSQSLGINLMEISNDDEIGNNNERNEQNRENIRAKDLEEIQNKKLNYEMKFLELKEKCNKFYQDMNGLTTIIDNYKAFLNETNQKMNGYNERLNISLIDVNNVVNNEGNRNIEGIYLQIDNISIPLVELDEILFNIKKIFGDNIENLLKEVRENLLIIDQKNYNDENHLNNIIKKISHKIEEVQNVIFIFEENKKNFDDKNKIIQKKVDDLRKNLEQIDRRRRENRSRISNPNEDNNNNNRRIGNDRGFDPSQSFLFKEKDLSDFYSSRYVFEGREEDMIENYIDEPQLIRKNWHEICYIYDDYDIHDIYYDIKAVGLSRNSFFPLCSHGFNYDKDIEIDSLTLNGEDVRYSHRGHSITFKINLHNSQIAKVHIIYKEYMNNDILSRQEREHRQIYRTEYYGIHKSLHGQMAKFSLILKGNFDIVNFKNYFLIRNKKNLNEKEYFWGGVVPYEGKMTLITLSKSKAVWAFSVTLTIRSHYNLNRTAIAVPIEFIGGNNEILNIKYSSPQTRDITLDQENRQYVIRYRNVHNNIGEFTIEGQLENKSSGEWEVDLTDDEIERRIPEEDKLCKPQLRNIAKKIIEEFDKKNKNSEFEFLDYMKIALWVKENIEYDLNYSGRHEMTAIDIYNMRIGVCHHFTKLSNALLYSLGYKVIYIGGYACTNSKEFNTDSGHAWSLIKVNNKWYPFDSTWGIVSGKLPITHLFSCFFNKGWKMRGSDDAEFDGSNARGKVIA